MNPQAEVPLHAVGNPFKQHEVCSLWNPKNNATCPGCLRTFILWNIRNATSCHLCHIVEHTMWPFQKSQMNSSSYLLGNWITYLNHIVAHHLNLSWLTGLDSSVNFHIQVPLISYKPFPHCFVFLALVKHPQNHFHPLKFFTMPFTTTNHQLRNPLFSQQFFQSSLIFLNTTEKLFPPNFCSKCTLFK